MDINIAQYIHSDPNIMLGKPVLVGTRITVELILTKLAEGFAADDLLAMYPHVTSQHILACIAYAAQVVRSEKIIKAA